MSASTKADPPEKRLTWCGVHDCHVKDCFAQHNPNAFGPDQAVPAVVPEPPREPTFSGALSLPNHGLPA